jgi:UDP-N-acetylmuramyl pentapeptide phosphotransferase/UDP-N-acetylglucosamine-1-phosphate transferase
VSALAILAAGFALSGLLVWLAPRLALLDRPESAPERKLQRGPVPRVGGIALALGLLGLCWLGLWSPTAPLALAAAFAVGLADDLALRGLPRPLKFALELGCCALFACAGIYGTDLRGLGLGFALALVALAAANTFDNADGALGALGCAGLWPVAPCAAALLGGFLPWNLWLRLDASRPRAYLGDAGSHLLGLLLVCEPRSAIWLVLPALDLVRLCWVRWRAGSRPWVGDRRHLAHRLQARGLQPTAAVLVLLGLASPAFFCAPVWAAAATALLFCAAVGLTPDPCPGPTSAG